MCLVFVFPKIKWNYHLRIDTGGVEPRFALFSITAEVKKIEYYIIYHLKGIFSLYNGVFVKKFTHGIVKLEL